MQISYLNDIEQNKYYSELITWLFDQKPAKYPIRAIARWIYRKANGAYPEPELEKDIKSKIIDYFEYYESLRQTRKYRFYPEITFTNDYQYLIIQNK
jgi:hypothetical protein